MRNENWNLSETFFAAGAPRRTNMRRVAGGVERGLWTLGWNSGSSSSIDLFDRETIPPLPSSRSSPTLFRLLARLGALAFACCELPFHVGFLGGKRAPAAGSNRRSGHLRRRAVPCARVVSPRATGDDYGCRPSPCRGMKSASRRTLSAWPGTRQRLWLRGQRDKRPQGSCSSGTPLFSGKLGNGQKYLPGRFFQRKARTVSR